MTAERIFPQAHGPRRKAVEWVPQQRVSACCSVRLQPHRHRHRPRGVFFRPLRFDAVEKRALHIVLA